MDCTRAETAGINLVPSIFDYSNQHSAPCGSSSNVQPSQQSRFSTSCKGETNGFKYVVAFDSSMDNVYGSHGGDSLPLNPKLNDMQWSSSVPSNSSPLSTGPVPLSFTTSNSCLYSSPLPADIACGVLVDSRRLLPKSDIARYSRNSSLRAQAANNRKFKPPSAAELRRRRIAANERERKRMDSLNFAFDQLRDVLPSVEAGKNLSKIETLLMAQEYIRVLQELVKNDKV
ncbi:unnamed protein product [Soboliphyme baturini]|uniref:BHLH domain-containing protein n=1 Tax=Soboliphyme baturini TaxID=241478 RepID=A0A183ICY1_9BILA|nr:unnamed protein product [Soboliphyme baturini]